MHPPLHRPVTAPGRTLAWIALGAALATIAHLAVRGFAFGVLNNIYHVPFVLRLYDAPAFASDAFYQSLRGYVSLVWPVVRLFATERNVESIFLGGHVLALVLAFAAFGVALVALRVPARTAALFVVALGGLSPLASVVTPLGRELLLGGYFTHTEIVHGLALLLFAAAATGRTRTMFVLAGLAVDVNVFAGAWLLFVATAVALGDPAPRVWRERIRALVPPLALGLLVAAPAIAWTLVTVVRTGAPGVPADYRAYLRDYFPYHFMIGSTPPEGLVGFAAQVAAAIAALKLLARRGGLATAPLQRLHVALAACIALIAAGAALPSLTDARLLLNLHLLRAAALTWWLAALLALAAIAALVQPRAGPAVSAGGARLLAGATAVALVGVEWPLAALALSIAAAATTPPGSRAHRNDVVLCVVGLVLVVANVALARPKLENMPEIVASIAGIVAALALMARAQRRIAVAAAGVLAIGALALAIDRTDTSLRAALVLAAIIAASLALLLWLARAAASRVPLAFAALLVTVSAIDAARAWSWRMHAEETERADHQDIALLGAWAARALPPGTVLAPPYLDPDFQWQSRHPSWVTWRSGAAVMWSPSFHPQWSTRMREVSALHDPAARIAYACANGIAYVLEGRAPPASATVLRREGRFALLAPRCAPPG